MTRIHYLTDINEFALCYGTYYNSIGYLKPCLMDKEIKEAIATIKNLRLAVSCNSLPYQTAQGLAEPHLKLLNDKAREIAIKHHRKPQLITFASFRTYGN